MPTSRSTGPGFRRSFCRGIPSQTSVRVVYILYLTLHEVRSLNQTNIKINRHTKAHATFVIYLGAHRRVNHRQTMSDPRRYVKLL